MKAGILSILIAVLFMGCAKMPEKVYIISGLEQHEDCVCKCKQEQGKIKLKSNYVPFIPDPMLFDSYDSGN